MERYDSDFWTNEFALLNRPGQADIPCPRGHPILPCADRAWQLARAAQEERAVAQVTDISGLGPVPEVILWPRSRSMCFPPYYDFPGAIWRGISVPLARSIAQHPPKLRQAMLEVSWICSLEGGPFPLASERQSSNAFFATFR
jgi:hypothetical protein